MQTCTLVLEYNYSQSDKSLGSVWLFNGDGSNDLENSSPLEELSNWVKIVGPVDLDLANAIHASLKKYFESSGVSVIDQGVAD